MKNITVKIKNIILIYVIIFFGVFFLLRFFLHLFNFEYRQWVVCTFLFVLVAGIIASIVQLINKIRIELIKIVCFTVMIAMLILSIPYGILIFSMTYNPEYVVVKDGHKLVAYVDAFLKTNINYYDYKNLFVRGKRLRLYEYYGKGAYNPFTQNRQSGHNKNPLEFVWYDDVG